MMEDKLRACVLLALEATGHREASARWGTDNGRTALFVETSGGATFALAGDNCALIVDGLFRSLIAQAARRLQRLDERARAGAEAN